MNTLDPRLKHIIREQVSLVVPGPGCDTVTRNIERAWLEMPECTGNVREKTRLTGACDIDGEYLEETRLDDLVNHEHYGCCPVGHQGETGETGVGPLRDELK